MMSRLALVRLRLLVLLVCASGAAAFGCAPKSIPYPEDHARYKRIDQAVQALRQAYVKKDLSALQDLVLPLGQLERVEQEVRKDFEGFETISLDFSIERIVIEGENIDVFVHWQGLWKRSATDVGARQRGHGVLRWVGVQSILLRGVEGDLPFGMASRLASSETPKERRPK